MDPREVATDDALPIQFGASAEWMSAIVQSSCEAIFSADQAGIIRTWNDGATELLGHTAAVIGAHLRVVLPMESDDVRQMFGRASSGDGIDRMDRIDTVATCASGHGLHVSLAASPIRSADGTIIGTSAIVRDITARLAFIERIEGDRRRLARAQRVAKLGSFEIDVGTGRVNRSDELWRLLGLEPGGDSGTDFEHIHPEDRDRVRQLVFDACEGRGEIEATYRIVRADGDVRWVVSQAARLRGPESNLIAGTMLDITERRRAELVLEHQATHDWLTDLLNPVRLNRDLRLAMANGASHVAVAVVDIDQFKLVNDRSGHAVGDETLRALARRLRAGLRDDDIVARIGGDEFVLARVGADSLDAARELADDALALLRPPMSIGDLEIHLTFSIGVTISASTDCPASVLRDADDAMYQAKRDGKNRVTVFDHDSRARAHRRQTIATLLPQALLGNELRLEYQPIIDLKTLQVAGFESLLRWNHAQLGTIGPAEFIPIAESTGMIVAIGEWVLDQSLSQLAHWRADPRAPDELWMSLNVSAPQLAQAGLVEQVNDAIRRTGVPAAAIHLEITESMLMDHVEHALPIIAELQASGVNVSIDDFGTGYSSLSYLSRLPIDTIKIDQSFIQGLSDPGHRSSIVRAMIGLADTLGLDVVAEGIEHTTELDQLRDLGCTFGQGFLWSTSLPPVDALQWTIDYTAAQSCSRRPRSDDRAVVNVGGAAHPSSANGPAGRVVEWTVRERC